MTTPVVALVGRPNVGKSTLFNRLTRTRDALVADFPGLTRDRKYGHANISGYDFIVIDTGGIDGTEEGVEEKMAEQSLLAIEEADVVLFLVDARAGLTAADIGIANYLRQRTNKTTVVVANKTDGIDADSHCAEFYQLGLGEIEQIAASQGRGVTQLMEQVLAPLAEKLQENEAENDRTSDEEEKDEWDQEFDFDSEEDTSLIDDALDEELEEEQDKNIKIAIVGRPNVGKSTLTNRILGEDRVVVYDMPGTTRDSIYIPMERDGQQYTLIDTAGVRKRGKVNLAVEKFSVIKTLQAIQDANVVLLTIDAREGISDQDLSLLGFILNAGRSLVIVVNKWDLVPDKDQKVITTFETATRKRMAPFTDFPIIFASALTKQRIFKVLETAKQVYLNRKAHVGTSKLNEVMLPIIEATPPQSVKGKYIKIKYCSQLPNTQIPSFVFYANLPQYVKEQYRRFLENKIRENWNLHGCPINIFIRQK